MPSINMDQTDSYSTTAVIGCSTHDHSLARMQAPGEREAHSAQCITKFLDEQGPAPSPSSSNPLASKAQVVESAKQRMAQKIFDFDRAFNKTHSDFTERT